MPVSLAHARMEVLKTQEYRDACRNLRNIWTPAVCRILAFWAILGGFGPWF